MARAKQSAGLLLYRVRDGELEVLLAHPGGPIFARRDAGVWTIPKGEPDPDEPLEHAAAREFSEETGLPAPPRPWLALGDVQQRGGKRVHAWAAAGDCDPSSLQCNTFELEWPPKSGRKQVFPELDRFEFFALDAARAKINPAQFELLERLRAALQRK
jgi:predicted NUDIX family NTP pyrophosphohydrolase